MLTIADPASGNSDDTAVLEDLDLGESNDDFGESQQQQQQRVQPVVREGSHAAATHLFSDDGPMFGRGSGASSRRGSGSGSDGEEVDFDWDDVSPDDYNSIAQGFLRGSQRYPVTIGLMHV